MRFVNSIKGLGDNIYQRAFVKRMTGQVALDTPWPQLYSDLPNVVFTPSHTSLRTQAKNVATIPVSTYSRVARPGGTRGAINPRYGDDGIIPGMRQAFGFDPGTFDLPATMREPWIEHPRYAVVRPVTVRREWVAASRNPLPQYIHNAAVMLRRAGYYVVSVADLVDGEEWIVGDPPPCDVAYHRGELNVVQLMRLISNASAVVGWLVPASIAAHVPAFIVCGGQGGYNSPNLITDSRMVLDRITFAVPDNFCKCKAKEHECNKTISGFRDLFDAWLRNLV